MYIEPIKQLTFVYIEDLWILRKCHIGYGGYYVHTEIRHTHTFICVCVCKNQIITVHG